VPLDFALHRLRGAPARGESVEAWARSGRYAALAAMAREARASIVLLAHHRGDQAETFLLQALRGAGVAGLAAMPSRVVRDGLTWARPWLGLDRGAIEAYVRRHRIGFVDDPSNADVRFDRNRLRMRVWPALQRAFPQAAAALAGAAAQAAQAHDLLCEVARDDLAVVSTGAELDLERWSALSPLRRRNAMRAWITTQTGRPAAATTVERLCREAAASSAPASWTLEGRSWHRYRGHLGVEPPNVAAGTLQVTPVSHGGLPQSLLAHARWVERRGGEQFQRAARSAPRSLKKQFQAAGVPAWARVAPLLVSADGNVLYVPGLGTDARALEAEGSPRVSLDWIPAPGHVPP
jgi:tRNA(Ile)-lysidine synthase